MSIWIQLFFSHIPIVGTLPLTIRAHQVMDILGAVHRYPDKKLPFVKKSTPFLTNHDPVGLNGVPDFQVFMVILLDKLP